MDISIQAAKGIVHDADTNQDGRISYTGGQIK